MIEIDNKVYRNLQEQVGKNTVDIEVLKKSYGYHGPFASTEAIDDPVDQALYLIGSTYPYEVYQYHELTETYSDLGPFAAAGPQGIQGETGPQGPQGIQGEQGIQGIQGIQGPEGPEGPQGPRGIQGVQGEAGADGEPGPTGASIVSTVLTGQDAQGGNVYTQTFDNGATATFTAPKGPQGEVGPQGEQGPQGETGATGPEGPEGPQGPAGADGLTTDSYVNGQTYTQVSGTITLPDYPTSLDWDDIQDKPTFATVATTGDYDDLSDKPDLSIYAESADLATVATTGDYDDLLNKPDLSIYAESADLATVATTGSYTDLTDKPTNLVTTDTAQNITATKTFVTESVDPTAPDVTLAIDGTGLVATSTLNGTTGTTKVLIERPASGTYTVNIPKSGTLATTDEIPTKVSDLPNDAGYVTSSALDDLVTTNTQQNITANKTFTNNKKLSFTHTNSTGSSVQIDNNYVGTYHKTSGTADGKAVILNGNENYLEVKDTNQNIHITPEKIIYTDSNNSAYSKEYTLSGASNSRIATLADMPTIGSGVLTIQKNGTNVDTFNANATSNKTINITVPTTTGELTNNSGFITTSALTGYATEQYVDSSISAISIPTKTSDLNNDSGFITSSAISNMVTTDTDQAITGGKTFKNTIYGAKADGTRSYRLYNDTNGGLGIGVYDNAGNNRTFYTLANYGETTKTIATLDDIPTVPTNVSAFTNDAGYITGIDSTMVTTALGYTPGTSNFSGDYDDLTDKPSIPSTASSTSTVTPTTSAFMTSTTKTTETLTFTYADNTTANITIVTGVTDNTSNAMTGATVNTTTTLS